MKLRKLRWLALGVALAVMGLGVYWAQPPRPTITSWDAPEMMKLRGEWQALEDSPPTLSKAVYVNKLNALDHLIERRLRNDDMAALAANRDGPLQGDCALRQFKYWSFTIARGGSWGDMLQARSASRFLQMPWRGQGGVGFRVARSSEAE